MATKSKLQFIVNKIINVFFVCYKILIIITRFIKLLFTLEGFLGAIIAFILCFSVYSYCVHQYNSVVLVYPEDLNYNALSQIIQETDEFELPDDDFKIYKNDLSSELIIQPGQSFSYILYHLAMPSYQVEKVLELLKKHANLFTLQPGKKISVNYDCKTEYFINRDFTMYARQKENQNWQGPIFMNRNDICLLKKLKMALDMTNRIVINEMGDNNFIINIVPIKIINKTRVTKGIINNNLYSDSVKSGTPPGIIQAMIQEYSFDVDFQRDIHVGDKFEFVFDEVFDEDGEKIRNGIFKYANLTLDGRSHKVYYFNNAFFNEKGESVKRALMKTPIDGARISSGFSNGRKHPILGYTRKHQGVDFAAPVGTPIYAAADGVVVFMGPASGYGNFISIKHTSEYGTNYAHLSKFRSGLRKGTKVNQRQIIGYVGMTGLTSGPHLHFEVVKNGKKINPSSQKFASVTKLTGNTYNKFQEYRKSINDYLNKDQ